jgi:hypothetical protein
VTFPTNPPPDGVGPFILYAIKDDGSLMWYRKDPGGISPYHGPVQAGSAWAGFVDVIPAGANCLYALEADGTLLWYRHDGFNDGSFAWTGPKQVGNGWTFPKIFSGGDGIVYAITDSGALLWYRHFGFEDGGDVTTWATPRQIGIGWSDFRHVTGNGKGHIYALRNTGELIHYIHNGYADGSPSWDPTEAVNRSWPWTDLLRLIPLGDERMLAVDESEGDLLFFRHLGVQPPPWGSDQEWQDLWETPQSHVDRIGIDWNVFRNAFALLPTDPPQPH